VTFLSPKATALKCSRNEITTERKIRVTFCDTDKWRHILYMHARAVIGTMNMKDFTFTVAVDQLSAGYCVLST